MAYTQTDLENIQGAISQGLRSVVFEDGRQVHFRSLSELMRVELEIKRSMDQQPKRRAFVVQTSKGL